MKARAKRDGLTAWSWLKSRGFPDATIDSLLKDKGTSGKTIGKLIQAGVNLPRAVLAGLAPIDS